MEITNRNSRTSDSTYLSQRRQAIDSLVAIASTASPLPEQMTSKTLVGPSENAMLSTLQIDKDSVVSCLKNVKEHRATVSQVAKSVGLSPSRLADALLSAKMAGLVKMESVSGETVVSILQEEGTN